MQVIKPKRLGVIHKTYQLKSHQFSVGALAFFTLDNDTAHPLVEYEQWQKAMSQIPVGEAIDIGFAKPCAEFLVSAKGYFHQHGLFYKCCPSVEVNGVKKRVRVSRFNKNKQKNTLQAFMPVDVTDKKRSQYNGTYDQKWIDNVHPGLPHDTNTLLFNSAPEDQQFRSKNKRFKYFSAGSPYTIKDMHPTKKCITGHLPNINVRIFVNLEQQEQCVFHELTTVLETVWFFPEINMGISMYRGVIEVSDSDGLDVKTLLMAYENHGDAPRDMAYYKNVLELRTNIDTAMAHLFNESQLMPIKTDAEINHMNALVKAQEEKEQKNVQAMRERYTQQALDTVKQSLPKGAVGSSELEEALSTINPEADSPYAIPAIPTAILESGDFDLTPMLAAVDKLQEDVTQDLADKQASLDKMTKSYQKQYQKESEKEEESIENVQQRLLNPVYIHAVDLKQQRDEAGGNGIADVIQHLPPEAKQQLNDADNLDPDALAKAYDMLLEMKRQARQVSPSNTQEVILSVENNARARQWVIELMVSQVNLAGRDLSGIDLSGLDFSQRDLRDVMFESCNLDGCDFSDCIMTGAVFTEASVNNASFINAILSQSNFSQSHGENTQFHHANLDNSTFIQAKYMKSEFDHVSANHIVATEAQFIHCSFKNSIVENALMSNADFTSSVWDHATVTASIFLQAILINTQWQEANLDRCMLIDVSAKGISFYRAHLEKVQFSNVGDLIESNFSYAKCTVCGFRGVDLNLSYLSYAVFIECDFGDTVLTNANLKDAIFKRCVMTKSILSNTDCQDTLFNESLVRKVDFEKSNLTQSEFYNCTLEDNNIEYAVMKRASISPQAAMK